MIEKLGIARYFLTVHDLVRFARHEASPPILCQGRGSAANSAVCYVLGITAVDPAQHDLLFERFISEERKEPPDIDVDFEHERREEVIQHIYGKYGRDRAGLCATVIHYRPRSAIREVGKVMGLSEDVTGVLAKTVWGSRGQDIDDGHANEAGLDMADPVLRRTILLARQLIGMPRHLGQHVGGFILTERPLTETVPIGNGAMAERSFIEWDKDDIDTLGILKIDILALGMLTCIRKCFDLIEAPPRTGPYPGERPARGPAGLRHALQGRQRRRLPGRKPGADEHAAAPASAPVLRSGDRGRHRPPWPDPGRHGASLPAPPVGGGAGGLPEPRTAARSAGTEEHSRPHPGRADIPGAGDEDRYRRGEVLARRGQ